jgi:hypothetical protein
MKLTALAGLAALIVAGGCSAALAQSQPDPNAYPPNAPPPSANPNVQSYQDYQAQRNAYDNQVDATAQQHEAYGQQREAYDQNTADYQAQRRAYKHRLRAYERARADYDAQYGPGAYERSYPPPMDPR